MWEAIARFFGPKPVEVVPYYVAGAVIFSVLVIILLINLPSRARKPLIAIVTFLAGLFYATEFFLPIDEATQKNMLTDYLVPARKLGSLLAGMTLTLGILSLVRVHGRNIARLRAGWYNSVALLAAMVAMVVFGLMDKYSTHEGAKRVFNVLFEGMLINMDATMFSLIAFYIVSASYRAFRIRSVEATILMTAAFLVMLGQVPVGLALTAWIPRDSMFDWMRLEVVKEWLLTVLNAAALRAIAFGLGVGGLAISLRIWLSLERGAYFEREI
ncbi:MAG: hypothetical protein RMM06_05295 [Armatimonadota bacterium]|nr:hypothetical protein [Armatimonadota bacterium]MDW8105117.1 hypothetical protein [Armatimonadota bacterium]MDW8290116.1 hypothetical protein [Armatimonadota bacterium]